MIEDLKSAIKDKRRIGYSVFTGIAFSLFFVLGYPLKKDGVIPFGDFRLYLAFAVLALVFGSLSFLFLGFKGFKRSSKELGSGVKKGIVIGSFIFIYLSWLVQLIGVYPGFFNYDATGQWQMYAESVVTAHHPVLHTYLVGKCIHLSFLVWGNALPGCFIYICFQMLITAFAYSRVVAFLLKKKAGIIVAIISIFWFSFAPTIVMCVLSVTKDSMFTPFLILFILGTVDFLGLKEGEELKWYKALLWYASAFFTAIMRNNALYIVIPFMIIMMVRFRKKKQSFGLMAVLALLVLYLGPFTKAVTVEGVKEQEYLSIPAQQIMRVYHLEKEGISEEDSSFIEDLFEDEALKNYVPKIADKAKGSIRQDVLNENKGKAISLWVKYFKKYPARYVEAFLIENSGFWYPWTTLVLFEDGSEGYYVCRSFQPVWNDPKSYKLYSYYRRYETSPLVTNNPLTMWIFAPATYFYLFFLTFIYLMYRKRSESGPMVMVFLIWLSFLLGPVALVRYVGFLFAMVPLELGLFVRKVEE